MFDARFNFPASEPAPFAVAIAPLALAQCDTLSTLHAPTLS